MRKYLWLSLASSTLFGLSPALAQTVNIVAISNPEFVEVQQVGQERFVLVSELEGLRLPVRAQVKENRQLHFQHKQNKYSISRAFVTVSGEKLVTAACNTAPTSIAADSRKGAVKGAGERCQ